jgi:hypothetical protein
MTTNYEDSSNSIRFILLIRCHIFPSPPLPADLDLHMTTNYEN